MEYLLEGHFLSPVEIQDVKRSWNEVIKDESGEHGINIFIEFFKQYPEMKTTYFPTLSRFKVF